MTLPEPKKGRVCSASRNRARAVSASLLLETVASMISWSMPPNSSHHCRWSCLARCLMANSSSPQMRASDGGLTAGILFGFAAGFVDPVQHLAHVLDLFKKLGGDKNRFLLRRGDGETIAGACVHLDNFPRQFVLLLQDEPREVGGILQIRDDNALDIDAEALKNPVDEVVGEGTLLGRLAQKHADNGAHLRLDVDDENFFIVAHKQRATAVGGKYAPDLHRHNIMLHATNLGHILRKTSPSLTVNQCGVHSGTDPTPMATLERRSPVRRVSEKTQHLPGRRPALRGQCSRQCVCPHRHGAAVVFGGS